MNTKLSDSTIKMQKNIFWNNAEDETGTGTIKDRPGRGHSPSAGSLNGEIRGDNPSPAPAAQPHFLPWMGARTFMCDNQVKCSEHE